MSTRYVWDKTVATQKYKQTKTTIKYTENTGTTTHGKSITVGDSYEFDESTGIYSIIGGRTYTVSDFYSSSTIKLYGAEAKYLIDDSINLDDNKKGHVMFSLEEENYYWELYNYDSLGDTISVSAHDYGGYLGPYNRHYFYETTGSGEHVEYLSGSTSNAYQAGVDSTGQYYLVYLGSDSIDPKSVSFSGAEPDPDGNMSVVVTPATNTLGGNVLYQYQYSIDNGSNWTNAGEKTAATTKEIPVPPEAEKFMVRVRAQDDIGFTSADYVTGANLEVQIMRLWVGVDNSARKGTKLWVGVDGVARRVVRAWVGDENGTARRWF